MADDTKSTLITSPIELIDRLGKEIIYYADKCFLDIPQVKIYSLCMGSNCVQLKYDIRLTANAVSPSWIYDPMEHEDEEYGHLESEFRNAHIILLCNLSESILNSILTGSLTLKDVRKTLLIYKFDETLLDFDVSHMDEIIKEHPISYNRIPYTYLDYSFNGTSIKEVWGIQNSPENISKDHHHRESLVLDKYKTIVSLFNKHENREGTLTVITGLMASGKSSRLLQLTQTHCRENKNKTILILPRCVQLKQIKCRSIIPTEIQIRSETYLDYKDYILHFDTIFIDDAHLFYPENLTEFVHVCQGCGIDVIIAGLSVSSFRNDTFKGFVFLMSQANKIELQTTSCTLCNYRTAKISFRFNWRKPSNFVGDHRKYLSVCSPCMIELAPYFLCLGKSNFDQSDLDKMCGTIL